MFSMHNIIKYYFSSSFNCLSKLQYSNFSIIMEYDDFVKFSFFRNCDFWFDPLHD